MYLDAVLFGKIGLLEKKIVSLENEIKRVNKIVDLELETPVINASSTLLTSIDIGLGSNRMIIQAIYIECASSASIDCEIRSTNKQADYFIYYKNSISNNVMFDNVQVPFVDDMKLDKLHLYLKNESVTNSAYKIRIMGVLAQ